MIENAFNNQALRVWFKIEALSLEECNPDYDKALINKLFPAKFYGHRFE